MLFAVAEVVFEMVALGLEHIVVLVFGLPVAATSSGNLQRLRVSDRVVGDPTVEVEHLAV